MNEDRYFEVKMKSLSRLEEDILRKRCQGRSVREIAQYERVAEGKIKGMMRRIFELLGIGPVPGLGTIAKTCYKLGRYDAIHVVNKETADAAAFFGTGVWNPDQT